MTTTTIRISTEVYDRLRAQADRSGRTLGAELAAMLDAEDQRQRFAALRREMLATPPDEAYHTDVADWQSDVWS